MTSQPTRAPDWDRFVRRWLARAIGSAIMVVAGCAWLVRNEESFWPAFALQLLAAVVFFTLIAASIMIGVWIGTQVGKLNGILGVIAGLASGCAIFFFVGLASTQLPFIGPAMDRIAAVVE